MRSIVIGVVVLSLFVARPGLTEEDAEGCRDHPLFTRFPSVYINECQSVQFDLRAFPVGPPNANDQVTAVVEVEGPVQWLSYLLNEGATPPTGLQIMRNFENAAKSAGGSIEGKYPGWCQALYDEERMPGMGNGCTSNALTLKFLRGGKETWVFMQAGDDDGSYMLTVSERESMAQDIAVTDMADKLAKDGFVTLYVTFDTGKSTITPDSAKILDDAAAALKMANDLQIEVGGHTDNTGTPEGNQRLSEERARAVMAALVQRGVAAARLTAKGYGQTVPIADNRTEEGRAANRRVELLRK